MADTGKQCLFCVYWTGSNGHDAIQLKFCHHLLYTGKRRVEVDGVCQSFHRRVKKRA